MVPLLLLFFILGNNEVNAQTTLINPATDGGFESGATFAANGWTATNSANNPWVIGTAVATAPFAGNSAYISNNGTANAYSPGNEASNFFWRDITVPAGETKITLTFNWNCQGEATWDNWQVFYAPTTLTPVASTAHPGSGNNNVPSGITGATFIGFGQTTSGVQTATYSLPAALAGTTFRIIFSWKNETGGVQPPAALDNISLISAAPGNYVSIATGNWSSAATWDLGTIPSAQDNVTITTGHTVSVDATGQGANNLAVNGTLAYTTTPSSFAVGGNLTINSGGLVNVFFNTTGKTLSVAGNITNNGTMDISVGTTSAGNLTLNGAGVQTLSGSGVFTAGKIRNLTCVNTSTAIPNINWQINNLSIEYNLNITNAKINLGANKFTYGTSIINHSTAGTFTVTNGGFIGGKFSRWWNGTATGYTTSSPPTIPTGPGGRYPFYTPDGQQRIFYLGRTGPTVGGEYAVVYNNATTITSGLSIADGVYTVTDRWDGNFVVTTEGSTPAATSYWTTIFAPNVYYPLNGFGRVLGQSAAISGTHLNSTAGASAQRSGVLEADLIAATGLYMGINSVDLLFSSIATGNWNNPAIWNKGVVPSCTDAVIISAGTNVTVNSAANVVKDITINSGATLTVASGDVTVGCTLNNNMLINNGTLTINGGTLTLNGRFDMNTGANLNQSGGSFVVDGNDAGIVANSVASGTPIFRIGTSGTPFSTGTIVLTGGEIVIVDPHTATTNTNGYALYTYFPTGFNIEAAATHTFKFGNGTSTDAGGNTGGFYTDTWPGSGRLNFGNLIVNNPSGTNRDFVTPYATGVNGNASVLAGNFAPSSMILKGNLNVTGTYIATGLLNLAQPSGTVPTVNTTAQTIQVTNPGVIKNLAASDTANLTGLTVNNSAGVTLNSPISVSGTITLTAGLVNTTSVNLLTSGTATAAGIITGGSATAYVNGPMAKTFATGSVNSAYSLYPVGKASYAPIWIAPTTTTAANIKAEAFDSNAGTANPSIINLSATKRWEVPVVSGTVTDLNVRLGSASVVSTSIPVQAPSAGGIYTNAFGSLATYAAGTPNTTQSNTPVVFASYTGYVSFADSNVCSGTPAPGNTIATATQICTGTTVSFSLENTTAGTGVTYAWESSTTGGVYTPIADATNATYSVVPTEATYYRAQVTCSGNTTPSTAVHVMFTNSITGTTPAIRCGTGTANLEAIGSVGTTIKWYDAATGGTLLGSGSPFTTPTISATATYYASAESSAAGLLSVGAGASTSATAAMPFNGGYGSLKGQYLFTAAELRTAGLTAGNITSLALDFTTTGGNYLSFEMSVGATSLAAFPTPANIQGGLTTVYTNASFSPTIGVNNFAFGTGTGAASFNWDGTSNIIVSICWTYGAAATSGTAATVKTDTYSVNLGQSYRKDTEASPCGFTGATGAGTFSYNLSTTRPRMTFNGQVACTSPRVAVVATVNTPPALTLSAAPASFCSGNSSALVTLVSLASDYDEYTWLPATGVTGTAVAGWTFNPTETTTYTLNASQTSGSLCAVTTSITITVDALPLAIVVAPSPVLTCVNSIQQLTATGGNSSTNSILFSENFNAPTNGWTATNNSTGTGTATPANTAWTLRPDNYSYTTFALWHSNDNSQFYLTNSDAGANGSVTATLLQSPSFSTVGYASAEVKFFSYLYDTAPASTTAKVQASIDGLAWTDLQAIVPVTTNAATNFTPVTVPLPAAFVDKPVVYVRFNYAGTWRYFWGIDNVSVSGSKQFDLTWSPVTNLYTDATATTPYAADTNAATVYFKSTTAATAVTYTVTSESDATCVRTATVDVTVNALPVLAITNPTAVCSPSTVDITAAAVTAGSDANLTLTYWTDANATTALSNANTVTTSGTYYIKAVNTNGCAMVSPVTVTVNALPVLTITNPTAVCSPSTVDITAAAVTAGSDANLTLTYWTDANATTALTDANAVATSGTYYIKAVNTNDCSTISPVTVTVNVIVAPTADATQSFDEAATVADLEVITGDGIKWYDAATAGTLLDSETALVNGGMYYASQTVGGCESQTRFEVTVTIISTVIDYANLQFPGTQTINQGGSFDVYAQVFDAGSTETAGANGAIAAWIGYSSTDENPNAASFTWVPATFNTQAGNNDEYTISLGATLPVGTYYYASRFQVNGGDFAYGGYSSTNGGFWNGTTNVNGVLTVQVPTITYANIQFPGTATIVVGETEDVYAQVYAQGVTEAAGAGSGITAWIGYSTTNENPNSASFTWMPASFNTQSGNNDEFSFAIGSGLTAGTYYYASRFQLDAGNYVYGGYSSTNGGFWNGTTNVNGVLTVNCGVVDAPTGTAVQDFTTGQTVADFVVVGDNIIWYDAATNGNVLPDTTVLVSGTSYYASQTVGGCESTARLMVTAGVNLRAPEFNSVNLKYYPNPVSDILTITYSSTIEAIEIFNVLGQRVYQKTHNAQEVKIDMSALATGNYIVNVRANGLVKNIKIMKK